MYSLIKVTKHAEKGVEVSYPTDPYLNNEKYWPNGLNQITNVWILLIYFLFRIQI